MLIDAVRFTEILDKLGYDSARQSVVLPIIRYIERKLGGHFVMRRESFPFGSEHMLKVGAIAEALKKADIVEYIARRVQFPDEPPAHIWVAKYKAGEHLFAGGSSVDDEASALTAALAEALERYVWHTADDYFKNPFTGTAHEAAARYKIVQPEMFASFTLAQRAADAAIQISPESRFLWIEGMSLTKNAPVHLPAQIVSALHGKLKNTAEPKVRLAVTTGLATGPTDAFAILNGTLECIERDAYMIWWLNQLTVPRFDPYSIAVAGSSLRAILDTCARYGLTVEALRLPTDAPAYVICAVIRDSANMPPFTIGLKAHRSAVEALEGAILEALRNRISVRTNKEAEKHASMPVSDIRLEHRLGFWSSPQKLPLISFMTAGPITSLQSEPWASDTAEAHMARIVQWAREKHYEIIDVNLGISSKNPLLWNIHMVVMPELQPLHLTEKYQYLGGERLRDVPKQFGYTPRAEPFSEAPHPLA